MKKFAVPVIGVALLLNVGAASAIVQPSFDTAVLSSPGSTVLSTTSQVGDWGGSLGRTTTASRPAPAPAPASDNPNTAGMLIAGLGIMAVMVRRRWGARR